jgi:alanyl-tRNA synthetase
VRVEDAVGPSAIQRQIDRRRSAARAADTLDTSVGALAQRAQGLLEEKKSLQATADELQERLLDARISLLDTDTTARNGQEWLIGTVSSKGPNAVADFVGALDDQMAGIVALAGPDGATFIVVGTDGETNANYVVDNVTDEFGGGGGGQSTLAQGVVLTLVPRL